MLEIYVLSVLIYLALGFLYTEHAWNAPDLQATILQMRAEEMLEDLDYKLAFIKVLFTVFWPFMLVGTLFYPILKKLGIIEEDEDETID